MKATPDRDLLVLLKNEFITKNALEQEVECLNEILIQTESLQEFCKAHELVVRNRITQKQSRITSAFYEPELKPFWFFISKN